MGKLRHLALVVRDLEAARARERANSVLGALQRFLAAVHVVRAERRA